MKTTLNIDNQLLKEASLATGVIEKTALIHLGLKELVIRKARERLASLGGSLKTAKAPPRKKTK